MRIFRLTDEDPDPGIHLQSFCFLLLPNQKTWDCAQGHSCEIYDTSIASVFGHDHHKVP